MRRSFPGYGWFRPDGRVRVLLGRVKFGGWKEVVKMNDATVHVALYARVSSDKQAQEGTIESQVAALKDRIVRDGQPAIPHLERRPRSRL